jgi:acetoin utilization deacetylase AcuC-like enzyme
MFNLFLQLLKSMNRPEGSGKGRVVSILEGGYDTDPESLGLARCVDAHVRAMRE